MLLAGPTCTVCGTPLEQTRPGLYGCPKCARRYCPRCGKAMRRSGNGRYTCPDGHGEWLEDDLEPEEQKKLADDYDPDPYRHGKTIDSQIRESGSGSKGPGRKRRPKPKRLHEYWGGIFRG